MNPADPRPAVVRPVMGHVRVRLPERSVVSRSCHWVVGGAAEDRRETGLWLRYGLGCRPEWDYARRCWEVARPHFLPVIGLLYETFREPVHVWTQGLSTEHCDIRCQEAVGADCVCACAGAHHGERSSAGWMLVSGTTLVSTSTTVARYLHDPDGLADEVAS